jgi:hypothetical protein
MDLPCSAQMSEWVRFPLSAGSLGVHEQRKGQSLFRLHTFWCKPVSIFGLCVMTTFNGSLHVLTIPFNPSPCPP